LITQSNTTLHEDAVGVEMFQGQRSCKQCLRTDIPLTRIDPHAGFRLTEDLNVAIRSLIGVDNAVSDVVRVGGTLLAVGLDRSSEKATEGVRSTGASDDDLGAQFIGGDDLVGRRGGSREGVSSHDLTFL
jgi:hypothetical protein